MLEPFDRFVLVMAVLEGYPLRECAVLLACTVREVVHSKSVALERLGAQLAGAPNQRDNSTIPWVSSILVPTHLA
jgi:hypothetical protein